MSYDIETPVQRDCQKAYTNAGAFVFKTHGDQYSRTGIPDLVGCVPTDEQTLRQMLDAGWFKDRKIGIFLAIETKRPADINKMDARRRAQEIVGKEIRNAGGLWFVSADPTEVEAIIKMLKGELNS